MKIAFTASGNSLNEPLDSRFGRAPRFLVYDIVQNSFETIDNSKNVNAGQGAGIQSAELLAQAGVDRLVTAHCGPKAFRVLAEAGIKVFLSDAPTVAEALEDFMSGRLQSSEGADVAGHWA